jgi:hypothetical protein
MSRPSYKLDVGYVYELLEEDIPVRGNAMASGDENEDRRVEDAILADLDRGHLEAWCSAHVFAQLTLSTPHDAFSAAGDAYMGGCSYRSEKELWESMTMEYDLEADALADAAVELRHEVSRASATSRSPENELKALDRLLKDLVRSSKMKQLMARQKRAERMMLENPLDCEWAQRELVHIDEALEKL